MSGIGARLGQARRLLRTRMVGHLAWSMIGQVAVAGVGLLGVRVLTELAPPELFGTANLLVTMLMLLTNIGVAPVTNTQARYHSRYAASDAGGAFTRTMIEFALRGGLAAGAVVTVGYAVWTLAQGQAFGFGLAAVLLAWIPVQGVRNALVTRILAERRQARQSVWLAIEAVAILAFTAGALLLSATPAMYLAGNLLATVLVAVILVSVSPADRDLGHGAAPRAQRVEFHALVRDYGYPFVVIAILSWLGNLSDRYVLAGSLGVEAVGVYAASFGIASRAMLMVGAVTVNAFRPALFEAESTGQLAHGRSIYRIWLMFTIAVVLLLVLLILYAAPLLARLLLAEAYRGPAAAIMLWVAIGYAVQVVNQVVESRIMSLGNSSRLVWPMIAGAVANLLLALLLIPHIGLIGAAIANAGSFALQLGATTLALLALQRRVKAAAAIAAAQEAGPC